MTQPQFNEAVQGLKQNLRAIDSSLTGDWLVGNNCTVADIVLASVFTFSSV